jgi:hypothetical protein
MAAIRPAYTAALNDYVRRELGYRKSEYYILGGGIGPWDWGRDNQYADTGAPVRLREEPVDEALCRLWLLRSGDAVLRREVHAVTVNLDPARRKNVTEGYYEARHMMYIDVRELAKLKKGCERVRR